MVMEIYLLALLLCYTQGKAGAGLVNTCPQWRQHYLHTELNGTKTCQECRKCQAKYGVYTHCSKIYDTDCKPCTKGTYSPEGALHCRKCRKCRHGYQFWQMCTRATDTKCRPICAKGEYYRKKKCIGCDGCPAGTYVTSRCFPTKNTLCRVCPPGTFSALSNNRLPYCNKCTDCRYGEEVTSVCDVTHDTRCGDCRSGMFRLESTSECALCSPCYSDEAGNVTNIVEECRQRNPDQSRICMPSVEPWVLIRGNHTEGKNYTDDQRHGSIQTTGLFEGDVFGMTVFVMACVVIVLVIVIVLFLSCAFVYNKSRFRWQRRFHKKVKQSKHANYFPQADLIPSFLGDWKLLTRPRSCSEPFAIQYKDRLRLSKAIKKKSSPDEVGHARSFPEKIEICDCYIETITCHIGNSLSDCSDILSVSATGSTSGSKHVS